MLEVDIHNMPVDNLEVEDIVNVHGQGLFRVKEKDARPDTDTNIWRLEPLGIWECVLLSLRGGTIDAKAMWKLKEDIPMKDKIRAFFLGLDANIGFVEIFIVDGMIGFRLLEVNRECLFMASVSLNRSDSHWVVLQFFWLEPKFFFVK